MVLCESHYNAEIRNNSTPALPPASAHSAWQKLTLLLLLLGSYQYVANPCHLLSKKFDVCFAANWVLLGPHDAKLSSESSYLDGTAKTLNSIACGATSSQKSVFLGRNDAVLGSCDHGSVSKQNNP